MKHHSQVDHEQREDPLLAESKRRGRLEASLHLEGQPTGRSKSRATRITADLLSPLISSFFECLTAHQRRQLESGSPGVATKLLLAELLFDIMLLVSNTLLEGLNGAHGATFSKVEVESCLGQALCQSFRDVLDMDGEDQTPSSDNLTALVTAEVRKTLNSVLSMGDQVAKAGRIQCSTRSGTVNTMLQHALAMLEEGMRSKSRESPRLHRRRKKRKEWVTFAVPIEEGPCSVAREESLSFKDSLVLASRKALQRILMKEVGDMTRPLLEESEYKQLQSRSSQEVSVMSEEISHSLTQVTVSPATPRLALPGSKERMKTFFTICFYRAWILHLVPKLSKRFHLQPRQEGGAHTQAFIDRVDALLVKDDGASLWFRSLSTRNIVLLTHELSDLIHSHLGHRSAADAASGLLADIHYRVQVFLVLAKWWWKTQVDGHAEQVCQSLTEIPVAVLCPPPPARDLAMEVGLRKIVVEILVEKLVSHIFKKAKPKEQQDNLRPVVCDLFSAVWKEVKDMQEELTPELMKDLDRTVVQELCERFNGDNMLVLMRYRQRDFLNCIALTVKELLTMPARKRKDGGGGGFFSSLGNSIRRFREKHADRKSY